MKRLLIGLVVAVCSAQVEAKPFRIVVIPDTQWAVQKWPHLVDRMTEWIAENRQAQNIKCVLHVGDMVQDGWKEQEWKRFDQSMRRLDGKVPYVLAVGNHDFDKLQGKRSAVLFNRFFPRSRLAAQAGFGDSFPKGASDNTYLTFAAGSAKWLVVSLKFHPDDNELAWANEVVARHRDHHAIILTHHYLTHKGRDVPGEKIWEQLVRRHGNIRFVICGHLSTVHYVDTADKGNKVYQMLFDWQNDRQPDNNSYLALIELDPEKKKIAVRAYSPQLDKDKTDRRARFEFADANFLAAPVVQSTEAAKARAPGAPLRALFLGDGGHHKPAERFKQIRPVLSRRGIQLTYTRDMADINSANLRDYDALVVYANIARIGSPQEKAILDYVAAGGGFVPLHCASYCFHNSPDLIALTGAQFKSHGGGVFRTRIAATDHPIMKGLEGFESWDETYVHHRHNEKDRTVLSYRDQEPWTWVRTHGKGRVFYTAWGHDHRTWGNPGFHGLVERGIRWAAGRPVVVASAAKKARVPLRYEPRPTVQNYEKRKPYPQYQFPLKPKDSMDYIEVEPGFDLQLFAAEPDIVKPMAFTWDHRGRLWLLESVDYPNTLTEQEKGSDRIKICEDTDGDGRADKFTVFAEGLNIPTGLTFANGGLIVSQAPHFLFFADTDGDDRADVRKVIMTGWGKGDTHAGPSNLKYGLDNWLYGAVGYSNFRGKVGDKSYSFGRGIYRFDRGLTEIDFLTQYSNNTWGLGISETGELFGSTANNTHHMYTGIPNRYFQKVQGLSTGNRR
ncbi:MAG: ThuA domain-containing protein, partial [Phycisphaerae bacterium]|nr:ThuA domain-containing protein [Phycisphaerae bacterium]